MFASVKFKLFIQFYIPQKKLTQLMGFLANSKLFFIKNSFIKIFCYFYKINMGEAIEEKALSYTSFHDFFIRRLKASARPIASNLQSITSPADGTISQLGKINCNKLIQAKGRTYTVESLLADDMEWARKFHNGEFNTIYLAPSNYHRVHMPVAGKLRKMIYVPGKLFSVSLFTAEHVPDLFARNERVICLFDTDMGPMAVILVGAMIVGSISTVWAGQITPFKSADTKKRTRTNKIYSVDYPNSPGEVAGVDQSINLEKGAELGYFSLGSTVITLFAKDQIEWTDNISENHIIQMGEKIANGNRI